MWWISETTFPGGKYNQSKPVFNRIEELYNDLIKKQTTYILYNKFKPVAANEDDKYYPYECAFDFEAMFKTLKLKIMKRNYNLYLSMCS